MSMAMSRLTDLRTRFKAFGHRHRKAILLLASVAFLLGLFFAIQQLNLGREDINLRPLLIALFLTQPLLIFLNSLELKLCGHAARVQMKVLDSVYVSSSATLANILPIPAGLIVRGGALMQRGASLALVSKVLAAAGVMWMAVALTVSGTVISGGISAKLICLAGLILIAILMIYIARLSDIKIAAGFLIIRSLMVALLTIQLNLCFSVLGEIVSLRDSAVYVVSGVAGAVVSIVPSGLGITEFFGATLAKLDGASPSLAYVVLSLNRLIGLTLAGLSFLILSKSKSTFSVVSKI